MDCDYTGHVRDPRAGSASLNPNYTIMMEEVGPFVPKEKRYLLKLEETHCFEKEQWARSPDFYS